jgi:4-hydroxy-tetrahydrodipicolinate reductase
LRDSEEQSKGMSSDSLRVVQWGTGNIGRCSLRALIQHPHLQLVGVRVFSDAKVGVDAGELAGLAATGVVTSGALEDIVALEPDCVLYMADRADVDALCHLLESGANVVATRSEFHRPASMDPEVRERIETACRLGSSSLHSTGSSPGFITEAIPLVLSSLERRLDCLTIEEFADMSSRNSPELLFDLMGFGRDPSTFDPQGVEMHGAASFGGSLGTVADALSLPLDGLVVTGEVAVARRDLDIAAGRVGAGTIAAQRMQVVGERAGQPLLRFSANWYVTSDVDPAWDLRETGWHVVVEGDVPLDVNIHFPVAPDDWADTSPGLTAHRAVNAVPAVCAALPGIRTIIDLPQIVPLLS